MSENFPPVPVRPAEKPVSPEVEVFTPGLIGLQVRLQLQGATLNPENTNVPNVTQEQLGNPKARADSFYTVFNEASTKERSVQTMTQAEWIADTDQKFAKDIHAEKMRKLSFLPTTSGAALYERYFKGTGAPVEVRMGNGTTKLISANVKQFVDDVIGGLSKDGALNYAKLQETLPEIQWFAKIFGATSAQIVTQLINAEAQLLTKPEVYVQEANVKTEDVSRHNNLLDEEKRLLAFLWGGSQAPKVGPTVPESWSYRHLEGPRVYPDGDRLTAEMTDPEAVAKKLQAMYPDTIGNEHVAQVASQIQTENAELSSFMESVGLDTQQLHRIVLMALHDYDMHLEDAFEITTPLIDSLKVIPIDGLTSDLYDPEGIVLGFVRDRSPAMFVNMKVIKDAIAQVIERSGRKSISTEEGAAIIERFFNRITIHEYTHLMGESGEWDKAGDPNATIRGRLGMMVAKPAGEGLVNERGRGVMEGVTEKLARSWFESKGIPIGDEAYLGERKVVDALIAQMRQDNPTLSEKDGLQLFIDAYFKRHDLRKLVETVEGKGESGVRSRPHHLEIVYAIMEKEGIDQVSPAYPLTLAYIRGNVTEYQRAQIMELPLSAAATRALGGTSPETPSPNSSKELRAQFTEFFVQVSEPIEKKPPIDDYFIENPPETVSFSPQKLSELRLPALPYFLLTPVQEGDTTRFDVSTDRNVIPHVFAFMVDDASKQERFVKFTELDDDDSGIRALAGTIAPTPEKQAIVYEALINGVLKVHEQIPTLVTEWYRAQQAVQVDGIPQSNSLLIFQEHDVPRSPQERLLAYKNNDASQIDHAGFAPLWEKRIAELRREISAGKLEAYHHRWLEMLAHSVNVKGIVDIIKSQST